MSDFDPEKGAQLAGADRAADTGDVLGMAPARIGPDGPLRMPVLLLDGTGERAGDSKGGGELHLAIGLVARREAGKRVKVAARLLAVR